MRFVLLVVLNRNFIFCDLLILGIQTVCAIDLCRYPHLHARAYGGLSSPLFYPSNRHYSRVGARILAVNTEVLRRLIAYYSPYPLVTAGGVCFLLVNLRTPPYYVL